MGSHSCQSLLFFHLQLSHVMEWFTGVARSAVENIKFEEPDLDDMVIVLSLSFFLISDNCRCSALANLGIILISESYYDH